MSGTITVKGTGAVSAPPDITVITLTLKTVDKSYDVSLSKSSEMFESLQYAFEGIGFGKNELKTTSFNVYAEHENVNDGNGRYKSVFAGYACVNTLRIEFGFDTVLLSKVLSAISDCIAEPELSITFSVKDKDAVCDEILRNAVHDALKKATVLASASDVKLGKLISINYDFSSVSFNSPTSYALDNACLGKARSVNVNITPENINVRDSVTFVWEIE